MQVVVDDAGKLRKRVTLTIAADELAGRENQLLDRYAGQVNLRGFRKGKAPKAVVRQRFGDAVTQEAQEAMLREAFQQALSDNELQPVGPLAPEEPSTDDGLVQVIEFDIAPTIDLPEPTSIAIESGESDASDEEVQEEIDNLCQRMGQQQDLGDDDTIVADDILTLTGSITAGEETVRDVHDLHHIVGATPLFGTEPEAVIAACADKSVGSQLELTTTLPDNFRPEEWVNKEATVSVTIQKAQRQAPAELNDELAKRIGAEDVDALRTRISEGISARKADQQRGEQIESLVEKLIEGTSFDLPEKLVESLIEQNIESSIEQRKQADAEADVNEDEVREEVTGEVDRGLRRQLLMDAIAKEYNVQATQQDINQQIAMAAYQSGRKPEDIAKQLQESGRLMEVANDIRQHKALELFLSKALGEDVEEAEPAAATSDA